MTTFLKKQKERERKLKQEEKRQRRELRKLEAKTKASEDLADADELLVGLQQEELSVIEEK